MMAHLARLITSCAAALIAIPLDAERIYIVHDNSMRCINTETGGGVGMGGGIDYDIAVSPDGRTLFHFAGDQLALRNADTLDKLRDSRALEFQILHRLRWIMPARPSAAPAHDGSRLYFFKLYSSSTDEDMAVATFDVANKRVLSGEAHLSECQGATLIPLHADRQLAVVCGGDSVVHFLDISSEGSADRDVVLQIPSLPVKPAPGPRVGRNDREESFVQSALTPNGTTLLLAKWDGRVVKVDTTSRQVVAQVSTPPVANTRIMSSPPCLSPDGKFWYLVARDVKNFADSNDRILVLDTRTLNVQAVIRPKESFWSIATSPDASRLYLIDRKSDTVRVLSTVTGEEIQTLGNHRSKGEVHDGPRFIVVAP